MRPAFLDLLRNLRAGLRLACFLRVDRLAFRIDVVQLVLLFALSAAIDIVGDWFRVAPPRDFSWLGAGPELNTAGLILLTSALWAIVNRQRAVALALPVIVMSSLAFVQAIHYIPFIAASGGDVTLTIQVAEYVIVTWIVLVLVRSAALAFSPSPSYVWLRAIVGGLVLAAPIWLGGVLVAAEPWWRGEQEPPAPAPGELNAGSEAVLAAQSVLLNNVLDKLKDERPGQSDLYFIAFAPYGRDDSYRTDAEAAQHVMDTRWGTEGRSMVLVNNPQTLLSTPFATVSNLRESLNEIGDAIDPDDDVVMLYIAGHGNARHQLAADQPPLSLIDLAPSGLKQLLDDAGIKWRIIVVSSCYSGGFIAPLEDDYTLIVTDAAKDRTTFGCDKRTPSTFFGDAFFENGLAKSATFEAAFESAKARVAAREAEAGYTPASDPQISMGAEMAAKLKDLRKRGAGGASASLRGPMRAVMRGMPHPRKWFSIRGAAPRFTPGN